MGGNDFALVSSIILAISAVVWLAYEVVNAPVWEDFDLDSPSGISQGHGFQEHSPEALDLETELLFCYPLDPFAPALLWRPLPQDEWIEAQEAKSNVSSAETSPAYLTS